MGSLWRAVEGGVCYGGLGAAFGAACGVALGFIIGLIFGGMEESIRFAVGFGAFVTGIACATGAVLWDDGEAWPFASGSASMRKQVTLFLCTGNSARSQMAEAFLKRYAADRFDVYSAGLEPKGVNPLAAHVMGEVGIDISGQHAKGLRQFLGKLAVHYAIIVCQPVEPNCPTLWPGALAQLFWPFEDPAACEGAEDEQLAKFRAVRDQIDARIKGWLEALGTGRSAATPT